MCKQIGKSIPGSNIWYHTILGAAAILSKGLSITSSVCMIGVIVEDPMLVCLIS